MMAGKILAGIAALALICFAAGIGISIVALINAARMDEED